MVKVEEYIIITVAGRVQYQGQPVSSILVKYNNMTMTLKNGNSILNIVSFQGGHVTILSDGISGLNKGNALRFTEGSNILHMINLQSGAVIDSFECSVQTIV